MGTSRSPGFADCPARDGRVQMRGPLDVLDSLAASITIIDEAGTSRDGWKASASRPRGLK